MMMFFVLALTAWSSSPPCSASSAWVSSASSSTGCAGRCCSPVIALVLAVLFRYGPCRDPARAGAGSAGAARFASVAWVVVSMLFSWYVANFGSYNKTYGSLGAIVGFMTWIWISGTVVLIGAQLDAELEKSTDGKQPTRASPDQTPVATS